MRPALSIRFVEKAEAALVAAIEIYNKPAFGYREETFALLTLNAWELLLKARILADNANDQKSLFEYEKRQTRSGTLSKKLYLKRNRAGNPQTIGLGKAVVVLDKSESTRLSPAVKANLDALVEVRDNAAHFVNASPLLAKHVLEVGTASITNFIHLAKAWFKKDLSSKLSLLLPIGFVDGSRTAQLVTVGPDERNLIKYLQRLARESVAHAESPYQVALTVDLAFKRSNLETASKVTVTNDPSATKVVLSEEDIRRAFPWDYGQLVKKLKAKYPGLKQNAAFHKLCKSLKADPGYVRSRYLDPGNPRSAKKDFYSPNVIVVFEMLCG